MTGEFILSSQTVNQFRETINTAFSGQANFNTLYTTNFKPLSFVALSDGATIIWDYSLGCNAAVTLGGNRALQINNIVDGARGILVVGQDGSGSRTLTLPTAVDTTSVVSNGGAGSVSLSITASSIDLISFFCVFDGSHKYFYWNCQNNYT